MFGSDLLMEGVMKVYVYADENLLFEVPHVEILNW